MADSSIYVAVRVEAFRIRMWVSVKVSVDGAGVVCPGKFLNTYRFIFLVCVCVCVCARAR